MAYHRYKDVKEAAQGNWLFILEAVAPELSEAIDRAPNHVRCPIHGGAKDFRFFKDVAMTGGGGCNSTACVGMHGNGFGLLQSITGKSFPDVVNDIGDALGLEPRLTKEDRKLEAERKKSTPVSKLKSVSKSPEASPAVSGSVSAENTYLEQSRPDAVQVGSASAANAYLEQSRPDAVQVGSASVANAYLEQSRPDDEANADEANADEANADEATSERISLLDQLKKRDPKRYDEIQNRKKELENKQAQSSERAASSIESVWASSVPLLDSGTDPARAYLKSRSIVIRWNKVLEQDSIRFHPDLEYWAMDENDKPFLAGKYPAIICAIRDLNGKIKTLHRTYLTKTGKKHSRYGDARKMMSVPDTVTGASIQLGSPVDGVLGLAEGLETALSAYRGTRIPCWSAINATLLERVEVPSDVHTVLIWADRDKSLTGQKVANTLAERLRKEGKTVRIMMPEISIPPSMKGVDWNDVLMKQGILGFPRT